MVEEWQQSERQWFEQWAAGVLKYDYEHPPKPKIRCRVFRHHWYTHILIPGPGLFAAFDNTIGMTRTRTICSWCKINKRVHEEQREQRG